MNTDFILGILKMKMILSLVIVIVLLSLCLVATSQAEMVTYSVSCVVQKIDQTTRTVTLSQNVINTLGHISQRSISYQFDGNTVAYGVTSGQKVDAIFVNESTYQPKLLVIVPAYN